MGCLGWSSEMESHLSGGNLQGCIVAIVMAGGTRGGVSHTGDAASWENILVWLVRLNPECTVFISQSFEVSFSRIVAHVRAVQLVVVAELKVLIVGPARMLV